MAKILIAAVESGAAQLTQILDSHHELEYGKTIEQVLELTRKQVFDLLIVGVLFDYSSMVDLIRAARTTSELSSMPVMGFSDEHTEMTNNSRDTLESVLHVMGASDYVDTRDMSDVEILERIEACLAERKPLNRKVQSSEETPRARRRSQEVTRWRNRLTSAASRKPFRVAIIGDSQSAARIVDKLSLVSGVRFEIQSCASVKSLLIAISQQPCDVVLVSAPTVQFNERDYSHLRQLAPSLPIVIVAGQGQNQTSSLDSLELTEDADGLSIALALLDIIDKNSREPNQDSALAKFLLTCLRSSATSLESGTAAHQVLCDFILSVEQYAKTQHSSDVAVSILLLDKDGKNLSSGAAPSLPEEYNRAIAKVAVEQDSGSCGTAAYLQQSVFVTDIKTDPRWTNFREAALKHQLAACWSVPIFDESSELVGTFAIYNRTPREPNNTELDLIGALSSIAAALLVQVHARDVVSK